MAVDPIPKAYHEIAVIFAGLHPDHRVMTLNWIEGCYCRNCGFPAPPEGNFCCEFSDRAEPVSNGERK